MIKARYMIGFWNVIKSRRSVQVKSSLTASDFNSCYGGVMQALPDSSHDQTCDKKIVSKYYKDNCHAMEVQTIDAEQVNQFIGNANVQGHPVNLQVMFHISLEWIHDTRNSRPVRRVFARTTKKANCVTVHGITFWNTIQDRIRRSQNLHTFKKRFSIELHSRYTLLV